MRHLRILGITIVIWSNIDTQDTQILEATVQNLVAIAIWRLGFVHPVFNVKKKVILD